MVTNKHNQKLINILENQKTFQFPCKWVLESDTRNISILRKPPYIFWFSNMLISLWLCLFVIKLYSRNDIFK